MKHWQAKLIVVGIMAAVGVATMALGIHFNLHFGLITVGNVWLVGAVLMAWMQ